MLRDKFVSGLRNTKTQHRLLSEKGLTFAKAQEIAQAMELADKDVKSLQSGSADFRTRYKSHSQLHKSLFKRPLPSIPTEVVTHIPLYAIIVEANILLQVVVSKLHEQCHVCGKIGHIARVCHNRYQNSSKGHTANVVESQSAQPSTTDSTEYTLFPIDSSQSKTTPWRTTLTLNGEEVEMEIDMGLPFP